MIDYVREIISNVSSEAGDSPVPPSRDRSVITPNYGKVDLGNEHSREREYELVPLQLKEKGVNMDVEALATVDSVTRYGRLLVSMEVGPYVDDLNKMPYLQHGLLQRSTSAMKLFHRDTSFGFFGFTIGTLAETIDAANEVHVGEDGQEQTYLQNNLSKIEKVRKGLVDSGYNVPEDQVIAYYIFYMSILNRLDTGRPKERRLSMEESKYISRAFNSIFGGTGLRQNAERWEEFQNVALIYRHWNGALDSQNKLDRLVAAYHGTFD